MKVTTRTRLSNVSEQVHIQYVELAELAQIEDKADLYTVLRRAYLHLMLVENELESVIRGD